MARKPRAVLMRRREQVPEDVPIVDYWQSVKPMQSDPVEAVPPVAGLVQETFSLAYREHTLRFYRGARCEPDPTLAAFLQSQNCPILWEANDVTER